MKKLPFLVQEVFQFLLAKNYFLNKVSTKRPIVKLSKLIQSHHLFLSIFPQLVAISLFLHTRKDSKDTNPECLCSPTFAKYIPLLGGKRIEYHFNFILWLWKVLESIKWIAKWKFEIIQIGNGRWDPHFTQNEGHFQEGILEDGGEGKKQKKEIMM